MPIKKTNEPKIALVGTGVYGLAMAMMINKNYKDITMWTEDNSKYENIVVEQKEIISEGHKWTDEEEIECFACGLDKVYNELKTLIPSETNKTITLPETVLGYQVTWESSDIDAMLNDGLIVARSDDRKVTLIATITINDVQVEKEIDVLVKAVNVATGQYDVAYDFYASKRQNPLKAIKKAEQAGYTINAHTNSSDAYSIADSFNMDDIIVKVGE